MGYKDKIDTDYRGQARTAKEQLRALRLGAIARVYQGADRILTGDPVVVNVVDDGPAPAWSDGASITLNAAMIKDLDLETIAQINGLNYHELSHHLYTPRKGTPLVQWIIEKGYFQSFNVLEDQRIDSLLCARYPSIMPYLTATVLRWLAETENEASMAYITCRGRRYLPVELRQQFRDMFFKPELLPAICRIVDEYRTLAFPRDYIRAQELVEEFHNEVMEKLGKPSSGGPSQCGHRVPTAKGRPEPGKIQERDAKRAGNMGDLEDDLTDEEIKAMVKAMEYAMAEEDVMSQGDGNVTDEEEQPSEVDVKPEDEELSEAGQQPSGAEQIKNRQRRVVNSTPIIGKGHIESDGGLPDDINTTIQNALNDIYGRKDVIMDVKRKQRIIINGGVDDNYEETGVHGKFDETDVPQSEIITYRKFAKELQRLRDDAEPMWEKEMPSGRLNVQRVIRGCEIETAFDRWTEQDDSCDIEAVICIDRSGSMSSNRNDERASLASWVIKRALESIGAPVTVYAFDDKTEVAYSRNDEAKPTKFKFIFGNGGTDPYESLVMSEKVLMASQKKNKMLFIITDGVFNTNKNDDVIKRMSQRGILTSMVLIMRTSEYESAVASNKQLIAEGGKARWEFKHEAEIFGQVDSGKDLLNLAKTIVVGAIKKRSRR
jgi:hypothetical protein